MRPVDFFQCPGCSMIVEAATLANMAVNGLPCTCGTPPADFGDAGPEDLGQGADEAKERLLTWPDIVDSASELSVVVGTTGVPLICRCGSREFTITGKTFECSCGKRYIERVLWVDVSPLFKPFNLFGGRK